MRIAFLSDIHANFVALKAVLADLDARNVDQVISLGDTVTMGPQPLEVLTKLKELKCVCIKGNHDAAVLDPAQAARYQIADHLLPDLQWCIGQLLHEDLEFIKSFRATYEFKLPKGVSVLCFHGSPRSTTDLIQATTPPEELDELFAGQTSDIFIGGHSHIQMHRRYGDKLFLNSGSVGNAFKYAYSPGSIPSLLPWAEYTILSQDGNSLDVDLRRVYYDTDELMKLTSNSDLPGAKWWMNQFTQK
jgi:putative phosphoesterase